MVWQVKQLLEDKGIPCFIKNEFAIGALGELSPLDCLPEVWLSDDDWQAAALKIIDALDVSNMQASEASWQCLCCHEQNEGSFEICWKCAEGRQD